MINYEEPKTNTVKFNKIGDYVQGTLVDVSETKSPDKWGKFSMIYTIKADKGEYLGTTKDPETEKHVLDKDRTKVNEGEEYSVFFDKEKTVVVQVMNKVKLGQKVMFKLVEFKETDKGNPAKIIKVLPGLAEDGKPFMDEEWLKARKEAGFGAFDDEEKK